MRAVTPSEKIAKDNFFLWTNLGRINSAEGRNYAYLGGTMHWQNFIYLLNRATHSTNTPPTRSWIL